MSHICFKFVSDATRVKSEGLILPKAAAEIPMGSKGGFKLISEAPRLATFLITWEVNATGTACELRGPLLGLATIAFTERMTFTRNGMWFFTFWERFAVKRTTRDHRSVHGCLLTGPTLAHYRSSRLKRRAFPTSGRWVLSLC